MKKKSGLLMFSRWIKECFRLDATFKMRFGRKDAWQAKGTSYMRAEIEKFIICLGKIMSNSFYH